MRQMIATALTAPPHGWDAPVCTSPSVRSVEAIFAGWGERLAERTGGAAPPPPAPSVIPLGVNAAALAASGAGRSWASPGGPSTVWSTG
jgi:hypothetical protein